MASTRRLIRLGADALAGIEALPDGPLLVALSGGADSATAAWAAVSVGRRVRAIHVHHGLAGSDMLASAAGDIAARLGIDCELRSVEVGPGPSLEGRARSARLGALESARRSDEWIVTGHTLDDQIETLLMRLARGTGLDGLVGIEARRDHYVRPLLAVSRSTTREIATLAGLDWRDDPENLDMRHLRNRVRQVLLPAIEATFGALPGAGLARLAHQVAQDLEVLEAAGAGVVRHRTPDGTRIAIGELAAVPAPVAARILRSELARLDPPYPPDRNATDRLLGLLVGGASTLVVGRVTVLRSGPWIELRLARSLPPTAAVTVPVPGTVRWGRVRFETLILDRRPPVLPLSPAGLVMPLPPTELVVRGAQADDRVAVGGGHKRVFDALAEAGVPAVDRPGYPVVTVEGRVVWLPGVRRAVSAGDEPGGYLWAVATEEPSGNDTNTDPG